MEARSGSVFSNMRGPSRHTARIRELILSDTPSVSQTVKKKKTKEKMMEKT